MHGSCRLHSCIFCRRLFGAARPCPGNGRAAGDDHHFSVRAAWHPGGFGYRDRLGHLSSAGGVFRLSHCAGLVASVVCSLAGLLFGVPYLLSDKTPRIDGKQLELQFEFKEDETWSDWISATQRADLTPVPKLERFAIRYRVQPVDR